MPVLIALHVLAAVIWVGGMFFAYMALRPAAVAVLESPHRLSLWRHTFAKFFIWVWLAIIILPATGYTIIFKYFGGMAQTPIHAHIMQVLGIIMILIFLHLFFAPYKRLRKAVDRGDFPAAGEQLNTLRKMIAINLTLGLITIVVATAGEYLLI